jgi:hypothetical protein
VKLNGIPFWVGPDRAPFGIFTRVVDLDGHILSERRQQVPRDTERAAIEDTRLAKDADRPVVICTWDGDTGILMSAVTVEESPDGTITDYPASRSS